MEHYGQLYQAENNAKYALRLSSIIKDSENDLNSLMWQLFEDYEKEMELFQPYQDALPSLGGVNKIPLKYIETKDLSKSQIIEQKFLDMGLPERSLLINVPSQMGMQKGVLTPDNQQIIISPVGSAVKLGNKIYDKVEKVLWL